MIQSGNNKQNTTNRYFIHNKRYSIVNMKPGNGHGTPNRIIICDFKCFGAGHGWSTVISKPFIPHYDDLLKASIGSHFLPARRIEIKVIEQDCNFMDYLNCGYSFQLGVIGIPKTIDNKHDLQLLNSFENQFTNAIKFKYGNCSLYDIMIQNKQWENYQTHYLMFSCINRKNQTANKNKNNNGNSNNSTIRMDKNIILNRYSCHLGHNTQYKCVKLNQTNKSRIGDVGNPVNSTCQLHCNKIKYLDGNGSERANDRIGICVDLNDRLYFENCMTNEIIGKNINVAVNSTAANMQNGKSNVNFDKGKIQLDFTKYNYLCALSSVRCDCKGVLKGFKFEITTRYSF